MDMGGIQRVNSVIANKFLETDNVSIYTIFSSKKSFYALSAKHIAGKRNKGLFLHRIVNFSSLLGVNCIANKACEIQSRLIADVLTKWEPSVVVLNAETILYLPCLKKIFPKIKFFAWVHNNASIYLEQYFLRTHKIFKDALNKADAIICLTYGDADVFGKYNKNTIVIYNPLTINNKEISALEQKIISWTGRLANPHKGIDYLAEVADKLPDDWKISVAGGGDEKLFRKFISRYNANDKIIYRGTLGEDKLISHYLNSSIYLMTSRWEGFPLVLAEAMSFGLPIAAFKQSGSDEVLDRGKYGILVENGNVNALVNELNKLINDIELRKEYQKKSLTRVQDFDINAIMELWRETI